MRVAVAVVLASLLAAPAGAAILGSNRLQIGFSNWQEAASRAGWSGVLDVSKEGLGWDGEPAVARLGWVQTRPLAIGLSWRPAAAVSVRVSVEPLPQAIPIGNGQRTTPDGGEVYARFSPDRKHWSSWQSLQPSEPQVLDENKTTALHYAGRVAAPYREREAYEALLSAYSQRDVPWKSDEEAAVGWILGRDPGFFSRHLPFVGYVELLLERSFYGGQRLRSLTVDVFYGVGGLHAAPRDESVYKERDALPWRFEAR